MTAIAGAASADRLCSVEELAGSPTEVVVTTDDGSAGRRGWVSSPPRELVGRTGWSTPAGRWGCCARSVSWPPAPECPSYVAVEESMACGIGVCMTCVLPVIGEDGRTRFSRSCMEGPVFGGDRVRFADVGTLPWDVVGADAMGVVHRERLSRLWSSSGRHVDISRVVPIPSPVLTASGCSAFGQELEPFVDLTAIGAVVTKSVQLRPRSGRPTPRMAETPSGMLNSIGLQGPGIDGLLADDLPWLAERGARAFVSIAGTRVEDFAELATRLRGVPGVLGLEVNISCPNVESRGEVFACDPVAASDVVAAVRAAADPAQPVYAKLSPDVTDIVSVARAVSDAGADGLSMINTLLGLVIDPDTMKPVLGGVTGGLSGPAIRPVALRCVWQVHAALPEVPILGMGGIRSGLDALQFVLAGASAVSVGTAVFNDPSAVARVHAELATALGSAGSPR